MNQKKLINQQVELVTAFNDVILPILKKHNLQSVSWNAQCPDCRETQDVSIYLSKDESQAVH